ncbi:MAG: GNAT family protein [Acidimicrobiia bacterium]|nr:GNAT family protein [Acidimicrobiia bacterium]
MVLLRPVESEDVGTLARLLAHPQLVGRRGLDRDRPVARSVASIEKLVTDLVDPENGDAWVIDSDGVVGLATCGWSWDAHTPWANVVIDPNHWRRGHGRKAADAVLVHLFSNTVAHLVQYSVPSWDADGLSFADSLGGSRSGIRRRTGVRNGHYHDEVEFHLLRAEWEGRRAAGG